MRMWISLDIWKNGIQQDINELKINYSQLKNKNTTIKEDISKLKLVERLQEQEIKSLKETMGEIKEGIVWIQRKITGAIITVIITGLVGGIIAIAVTKVFQ